MHQTLLTETRMCLNALEPTYDSNEDRVAEHRAIAEALQADDPTATDRLLVAHMRDGVRRLVPEPVEPPPDHAAATSGRYRPHLPGEPA
ncbi:hypothetical protein GCM10025872_24150 [Barrientosiimonas endolithica]|uniref:GntR C-terminal domain-containing protein n=1 Tax=Barrientosiimonas endolithica TaxID=1535208 RepID=A0ABM8HD14_9MICO|nr:hypothetical protein GCM10025872_24150 [Barrientosiimonas endolithica]